MAIKTKHINDLTKLLSAERLAIGRERRGADIGAVEFHQASLKMGLSLMGIIGTIEIALRNAVADSMNNHFGRGNWLKADFDAIQWAEEEKEMIYAATDKAYMTAMKRLPTEERNEIKHEFKKRTVGMAENERREFWNKSRPEIYTDTDLISGFTMFFWKKIYSKRYTNVLWEPALKATFAETRIDVDSARAMERSDVHDNLDIIHIARNRMAHYEPVLNGRFDKIMESIDFIIQHLDTDQPGYDTALAHLLADDIDEVKRQEAMLRG